MAPQQKQRELKSKYTLQEVLVRALQEVSAARVDRSTLHLKPMDLAHRDEFVDLVSKFIRRDYDDIDDSFAQSIIQSHQSEEDPFDFFTKKKVIWSLERHGSLVGFTVATEKRGGSVKLGPVIVEPEFQRKRYGTFLWHELESYYSRRGIRKLFATWPSFRWDFTQFAMNLGWTVEAKLREQYRENQDEYVGSRLLIRSRPSTIEEERWSGQSRCYIVRHYRDSDYLSLQKLMLEVMCESYDEIDSHFVASVVDADKRFNGSFELKGKKILLVETDGELASCSICSPKRGGSVKISPFIVNSRLANEAMVCDLLSQIEAFFGRLGYRKLYATIPSAYTSLSNLLLKSKFLNEGLLREPYKPGVNNIFFGKLLKM
jgi:GNAT superfamily N-acetyltransferase